MMKTQEEYYQALENLIDLKYNLLNRTVDAVRDQDVSNYPIIVVSHQPIEIGIPLSNQSNLTWHINASTLEEMVVKNVIVESKVDEFRKLYNSKTPEKHYCFFLVDDEDANFVFHPRKG
ncbi:MAG: hypothetical protein KJP00_12940 [Bacteroidia bacterium]|nr:hypothetical protein [Bacteroidia bacterium]